MMFGKLANIGHDISDQYIRDTSLLKKLITGEVVKAEEKGKPAINFVPYAMQIYSANDMPRMKDPIGAMLRRVPRIRIHDIRHSAVSLLIDMGFSATAIADRVGHESIDITYNYAHLFPSKQTEMADKCQSSAGRTSGEIRKQNQARRTAYQADLHGNRSTYG